MNEPRAAIDEPQWASRDQRTKGQCRGVRGRRDDADGEKAAREAQVQRCMDGIDRLGQEEGRHMPGCQYSLPRLHYRP